MKLAALILVMALAVPSWAVAADSPDHVEFYLDSDGVAIAYRVPADDGGWRLPTGDAVLVAADYAHPQDRVDNTGAFLPANGKPTLVFVDAIW